MDALTLIGERYRLGSQLASGGMGTVWDAHDTLLDRPVAVKVLHPGLAGGEEFRRRFRAEARAAARLSHPGVVTMYDYGEDGDVLFLAMELVPGESLHETLRRRAPLGVAEVMGITGQAADALAEAHARGLVHRDVKPANLLMAPDGTVKVADFGIARSVHVATMTTDGSVLGTVAYMSPEQIRGRPVAPPSDVYSLGVVAYEALAGRRPFPGEESIAVALSHVHDPVPALPASVPGPVAALVTAMLAKDPSLRPTARQVAQRARQLADYPWTAEGSPGAAVAGAAVAGAAVAGLVGAGVAGAGVGDVGSPRTQPLRKTQPLRTRAGLPPLPQPLRRRTVRATAAARAAMAARALRAPSGRRLGQRGTDRMRRRPPSAKVLSSVTAVALVLGLGLAAALSGSGITGPARPAAAARPGQHPAALRAAAASHTRPSSTTTSLPVTTTTAPTTTTTTAPPGVVAGQVATLSPGQDGPGSNGQGSGGQGSNGHGPKGHGSDGQGAGSN